MSEPEGGLYPWQGLAVAEVMASLKENPCLVAPTGGGKTSMAAELARILDRRTVFVAHRNEILDQAHARLRKAGVVAGRIQTGEPIYPQLSVQVASKDKLHRRPLPWKPELFIVDECFPAGTPISVPGGSASIEDIRIGDEVVSFDEASGSFVVVRVSFVFRKRASALLRVRAGGADVFCTPGHPFFTQRGWVQASLLTCGDMVLTIGPHEQQALPFLRDGLGVSGRPHALVSPALLAVQAGSARKEEEGRRPSVCGVRQGSRVLREVWAGSSQTREGVLLGGLHEGLGQEVELQDDGGHEPPMRFKEDEAPQSHEASRGHGEDEGQVAVHGVGSQGQRWPRKASSSSAGGHGSCSWVAGGGHRPYEDEEVGWQPHPLQLGCGERGSQDRRGGGRRKPRGPGGEGQRQEEGRVPSFQRVEGVSVYQPAGGGGSGGLRENREVFNLEVEGTNTYVANGFVVHNCHHSAARTWQKVLEEYPDVPRIGLTATPFRMDGKPLNHLYQKLVIASYFDDLVGEGLLVDPMVKSIGKANREGIPVRGGEFRSADVEERMNTGVLVGDCVDTWLRLAKGRRTLLYASGIKHSLHLCEKFREAGVRAEHVDGKTKKGVRKAAVQRLEQGEIDILSNVDVFTEGTDIPSVEVAVIERMTNSLTFHLQIGGRVVRACPGKEGALILDHAGNFNFHGPLSQRLVYSLDGKVEKADKEKPSFCKECGLLLRKEFADECPLCGWKAPPPEETGREGEGRDLPLQVPGELVDYESLRADVPFTIRKSYWDEIEKIRVVKGYKAGWSFMRYCGRFKEKPVLAGRRLIDPGTATDDDKYLFWKGLEEFRRERQWKPGWSGYQFKRVFGTWPRWRAA